jgi:NAD(P)-dependent dehydrogenase (short-subunit alcohol dehydrogenase family)
MLVNSIIMSVKVMARLKPRPGHYRTLQPGRHHQIRAKEVAMGKGGVTYSVSKAAIVALSMSLAVLILSRITWWT